jgi:polysaccharide pyruvyl transferase WcaK-like protein
MGIENRFQLRQDASNAAISREQAHATRHAERVGESMEAPLTPQGRLTQQRGRRFLMIAAAGGHNLGDEALIQRNMDMLLEAFPGCRFVLQTRSEERTRQSFAGYPVEIVRVGDLRFLSPSLILKALHCDAVIACGGIFFEHSVFRLRYGFVGSLPPLLAACRWASIPILALNVGVQRPTTALGRLQTRTVLNLHDHIFLRDPRDAPVLQELGVRTPFTVSADSALVPGASNPARALTVLGWKERPARLIGWNLPRQIALPPGAPGELRDREPLARRFAEAIRGVARRLDAHALLVATVREDHQFLLEVAAETGMPERVTLAPYSDAETTRQCIGLCDLLIGTRLHSLVFAAAQGTPCMALPNRPKSAQFIELAGLPAGWALMDWWKGTEGLIEPVAAAWEQRAEAKETLRRFVQQCEPKTRWGVQWLERRLGGAGGRVQN